MWLYAAAAALCLCFASNAAAIDCNAGPRYAISGPVGAWEYVPNDLHEPGTSLGDDTCWANSGWVGATMSTSCYSWNGFEMTAGFSNSMTWSHTVTASDHSDSQWTASIRYDFDDPHNTYYSQLFVTLLLYRNGSLIQQTSMVQRVGSSGIDENCGSASARVTPAVGDVIQISISGAKLYSDAHIRVTDVHLQSF